MFTNYLKNIHQPDFSTKLIDKNWCYVIYHLLFDFYSIFQYKKFTYTACKYQTDNFNAWQLTQRSVIFLDNHIILSLSSSKTNLFCQGVILIIAQVNNSVYILFSYCYLYKYFLSYHLLLFLQYQWVELSKTL